MRRAGWRALPWSGPTTPQSAWCWCQQAAQDAFEDALKIITAVKQSTRAVKYQTLFPTEVKDVLGNAARELLTQKLTVTDVATWNRTDLPISPEQVLAGSAMPAGQIAGDNPILQRDFASNGLAPDQIVMLRPILGLMVQVGGLSYIPPNSHYASGLNGQLSAVAAVINQCYLGIW